MKSHDVPSQVAVAWLGGTQGLHEVPQDAMLLLLAH
jgi:hypothetical protein